MRLLAAIVLAAVGMPAPAQQPKPCDGPEHRQFDFWVGDWTVTTPDGRHAGDNRVETILDGCALAESWHGASGGAGHSYNAFDRTRRVWHQTWVDQQGNLLSLEGGLSDGKMVLSGMQGKTLQRITWTPRGDGTVVQLWESSRDQGKTWRTVFHGIYARRSSEPAATTADADGPPPAARAEPPP